MKCPHKSGHPMGFTCPVLDAAVASDGKPRRPVCSGCGKTHYKANLYELCRRGELKRPAAKAKPKAAPAPRPQDPDAVGGTE